MEACLACEEWKKRRRNLRQARSWTRAVPTPTVYNIWIDIYWPTDDPASLRGSLHSNIRLNTKKTAIPSHK